MVTGLGHVSTVAVHEGHGGRCEGAPAHPLHRHQDPEPRDRDGDVAPADPRLPGPAAADPAARHRGRTQGDAGPQLRALGCPHQAIPRAQTGPGSLQQSLSQTEGGGGGTAADEQPGG